MWRWVARRSRWRCGRAVQKRVSLGQTDRSGLGECAEWVLGGFSGRPAAQSCQNKCCLIIHTKTPALKDEICCWIFTINHCKRHWSMNMKVRSGTPVMRMAMAPPERRECVPMSSGENPRVATLNRRVSALMTEIMFQALTEWSPWAEPLSGAPEQSPWEEPLSGRMVADWGGGGASVFSHAEEDVYARLDWSGFRGLWSEVRDSLTLDVILLAVQGEDDICGML